MVRSFASHHRSDPSPATPSIIFLGHNASRSGAPIVLLHLLRWLRSETNLSIELLLLEGGALEADYRAVVPTSLVNVGRLPTTAVRALERLTSRFTKQDPRDPHVPARMAQTLQLRRVARLCEKAELLYINSIQAAAVLHQLKKRPRTVVHVHEMAYGLRHIASRSAARGHLSEDEYLDKTLRLADTVLVPSEATRTQLIDLVPSAGERCKVIPEMIDLAALKRSVRTPEQVRAELNVPSDASVVVACGSFDWRKATDLFVQVAARVTSAMPSTPVYFLWVGAPREPPPGTIAWLTRRQFDFDVHGLGLDENVILIPPTADPAAYLRAADVFLLPSREDPFPLVAIEAAALGKPVVCFASSGTAEMVAGGAGEVVPHLDVVAMSNAVQRLLMDEAAHAAAGAEASRRATEYDVSKIAPRALRAIQMKAPNSA